jgi:hypothetical protein
MLVERGLRVMSVEVVGDAYAIASNYLRQAGVISDSFVTDERLLQIIVALFQRGECNKIRLANKAITQFEAELVWIAACSTAERSPWKLPSTASCRPMIS